MAVSGYYPQLVYIPNELPHTPQSGCISATKPLSTPERYSTPPIFQGFPFPCSQKPPLRGLAMRAVQYRGAAVPPAGKLTASSGNEGGIYEEGECGVRRLQTKISALYLNDFEFIALSFYRMFTGFFQNPFFYQF